MADRPVFISSGEENGYVSIKEIEFEWFPGFSVKQKQRSIDSFHENINKSYPSLKVLEISSKSKIELGVALSAFNLKIKTKINKEFSVETAFQASKVFEFGGPFIDLYEKTSKEAKKDPRLKSSGKLLYFQYFDRKWDLEPKTFFYDWLYTNALSLNKELSKEVVQFDAFTDIEFNPEKSINCQAKSVALYVSLNKAGLLEEALSSIEKFKQIVYKQIVYKQEQNEVKIKKEEGVYEQISIFDELD